jgi:hypothetical protein
MDLMTPRVPPSTARSAMDLATPAPPSSGTSTEPYSMPALSESGSMTAPYSNAMSLSSEASDVVDLTGRSPSSARSPSPIDLCSPRASPAHDRGA